MVESTPHPKQLVLKKFYHLPAKFTSIKLHYDQYPVLFECPQQLPDRQVRGFIMLCFTVTICEMMKRINAINQVKSIITKTHLLDTSSDFFYSVREYSFKHFLGRIQYNNSTSI